MPYAHPIFDHSRQRGETTQNDWYDRKLDITFLTHAYILVACSLLPYSDHGFGCPYARDIPAFKKIGISSSYGQLFQYFRYVFHRYIVIGNPP